MASDWAGVGAQLLEIGVGDENFLVIGRSFRGIFKCCQLCASSI